VTGSRTGLAIIRAWVEPGSSSPLRVQIRLSTDVSQGFEQSLTAAEKEAVVEAVQAWLEAMLEEPLTGEDDPGSLSSP
jgi:hypothetical protein